MNHVVGHSAKKDYVDVIVNDDDVVVCEMHGRMTGPLVSRSLERTQALAKELRAKHRPAYLFIDASHVTGHDSAARSLAKTIGTMGFAKVAIYNRNFALAMIVQYLIRSGRMSNYARVFRGRKPAMNWLLHEGVYVQQHDLRLRIGVAVVVMVLALAALIGWATDETVLKAIVPGLKPMNPMVAVLLLLEPVVLLVITKAKARAKWRAVLVSCIAGVSGIFGMSVLARVASGGEGWLDGLLFHGSLHAGSFSGYASPRTAIIFVLLAIMQLAVLSGQRRRWQQYIFHTASVIVTILALSSIVGYGFGSADSYATVFLLPIPLSFSIAALLINSAMQTVTVQRPFFAAAWNMSVKYGQSSVIFLVIILITGIAWNQTVQNHNQAHIIASNQELLSKKNDMEDRISAYISALRGYRSYFASSELISVGEFSAYYSSSQLETYYPGFSAINFTRSVPASQRAVFEAEVRKQATKTFPAYAQFKVYPTSSNATLYPITYIQPITSTTSYGFDLSTSAARRVALEQARDSGDVAATGTIDLNASRNDTSLPKRPGFFITMPIYNQGDDTAVVQPTTVEARRATLYGFVNAVFEDKKLFDDIFKNANDDNIKYVVSNARTGEVVYTLHGNAKNVSQDKPYTATVAVAGQFWQLATYTAPTYGDGGIGRYTPIMVLGGGMLVAVLAAALSVAQVRRKEQALALASAMTEDLNHERDEAITVQQKDEAILSSIGDAVFAVDAAGMIILFNRTAENITGQTEAYALGRHYKELFKFRNQKDNRLADGFIKTALSGRQASMAEGTVLERVDGSTIPVADSAAPIVNSQGEIEGAVVVFRDVTHEKELERLKNEFVSMASHELRTPMGAIRAFVSMILAGDYGPVNKNLTEPLNDIRNATLRLVDLVNDLLNVARIEAGRMKFNLQEIKLHDLLKGVADNLGPLAKERGLHLTVSTEPLPTVQADPDKVIQVLTNLVGNALKFTDNGGISLTASAGADTVVVTVTDTGMGISEADQKTLFGKFEQVSSVQEGRPAGTGLGLYISREMIRKMGGELWIQQSAVGKGTTFAFMLPLVDTPLAKRVKIDRQRDEKTHPDAV